MRQNNYATNLARLRGLHNGFSETPGTPQRSWQDSWDSILVLVRLWTGLWSPVAPGTPETGELTGVSWDWVTSPETAYFLLMLNESCLFADPLLRTLHEYSPNAKGKTGILRSSLKHFYFHIEVAGSTAASLDLIFGDCWPIFLKLKCGQTTLEIVSKRMFTFAEHLAKYRQRLEQSKWENRCGNDWSDWGIQSGFLQFGWWRSCTYVLLSFVLGLANGGPGTGHMSQRRPSWVIWSIILISRAAWPTVPQHQRHDSGFTFIISVAMEPQLRW